MKGHAVDSTLCLGVFSSVSSGLIRQKQFIMCTIFLYLIDLLSSFLFLFLSSSWWQWRKYGEDQCHQLAGKKKKKKSQRKDEKICFVPYNPCKHQSFPFHINQYFLANHVQDYSHHRLLKYLFIFSNFLLGSKLHTSTQLYYKCQEKWPS